MEEGTKVKIGKKTRIILPSGNIHRLSSATGKILGLVLEYKKGEWYNAKGKIAQFDPKDKKALLTKLRALQKKAGKKSTKTAKKPTPKVKKPTKVPKKATKLTEEDKAALKKLKTKKVQPKTPKVKNPKKPVKKKNTTQKPLPSSKLRVKDLQGMTQVKVGNQYICTFEKHTFYVRPAPATQGKGWMLVDELPNGDQAGIPGVFKTPENAMHYYKKLKEVDEQEMERIKKHKGGRLVKKTSWKQNDRIVIVINNTFRIGKVVKVHYDWLIKNLPTELDILLDGDGAGRDVINLKVDDTSIMGKGIAKESKEPIPPVDIDKWIVKEKGSDKKEYSYILHPKLDLPIPLEEHWKKFKKDIWKFIKDPMYKKMCQEYMLEWPLEITEPDPSSGNLGTFWEPANKVSLNWKLIVKPDAKAAMTLVHEVVHYKLSPVRNKILAFLKKNVHKVMGLNPGDPKVKLWFARYATDKFSRKKLPLSAKRVSKLLDLTVDHFTAYGLTHYFETPATYLGLKAVGMKLDLPQTRKLADMLEEEFKAQLKK